MQAKSRYTYRLFAAVKEDISEQKKMLDELIFAKEKAEEIDHLKSAFLANISHEIRTPMNGILGFSELLKEPQLSGKEMAEYIELIHKSGQRMLNLINDLIDISRIDAQETKLQITETPLLYLVKRHPDIKLVLMDIKMPLLNGYEATRQIKLIRPDLPVIAQAAFTSKEDKEKAKRAGFDRFITKPIKKSELLEMIQDLLRR